MIIRYPGSKKRGLVSKVIAAAVAEQSPKRYCEPFAGSLGTLFLAAREMTFDRILINDANHGIAEMWRCVYSAPERLCEELKKLDPSVTNFERIKKRCLEFKFNPVRPNPRAAAEKIALHQWSFSGLGDMSGPIGGESQEGEYKVGCRWDVERLSSRVEEANSVLEAAKNVRVTCKNACSLLGSLGKKWFVYADPPYFKKGSQLYSSTVNHEKLSDVLISSPFSWLLSYDDCVEVRSLYPGQDIAIIEGSSYTIPGAGYRTKSSELLIRKGNGS